MSTKGKKYGMAMSVLQEIPDLTFIEVVPGECGEGVELPEERCVDAIRTHVIDLERQLTQSRRLYEELRRIIDGGSKSMTHEDAIHALHYNEQELALPISARTPSVERLLSESYVPCAECGMPPYWETYRYENIDACSDDECKCSEAEISTVELYCSNDDCKPTKAIEAETCAEARAAWNLVQRERREGKAGLR